MIPRLMVKSSNAARNDAKYPLALSQPPRRPGRERRSRARSTVHLGFVLTGQFLLADPDQVSTVSSRLRCRPAIWDFRSAKTGAAEANNAGPGLLEPSLWCQVGGARYLYQAESTATTFCNTNRRWASEVEPLRKVNSILPEKGQCLGVLDALGDRLVAEVLGQADDRLDEVLVGLVGRQVPHELDVDLQIGDGRLFR